MVFSFVFSVSSVSAASTVYVNATTGSDHNLGTIDHPFLTINKGISSVDEYGTVKIANGVYKGSGNTNIDIAQSVNIKGQSQKGTIIDGTGKNSIFNIYDSTHVTITNLAIINGDNFSGGAIDNNGNLTVSNCTFKNNMAIDGGAINNDGNINTLNNCIFINNTANVGGAIENTRILSVNGCKFTSNSADYDGGAIYNFGTISTLSNSTFSYNKADKGGALCNLKTILSVKNCIFVSNSVNEDMSCGGAIYNDKTINRLTCCKFTGNAASGYYGCGGAICGDGGITYLNSCSFTNNKAGSFGGAIQAKMKALSNCTFLSNVAYSGGAIDNERNLVVTGCTFVNNKATCGGAICHGDVSTNQYKLTARFNSFVNNRAPKGSGVYNIDRIDLNYNWWGSNAGPVGKIKYCTASKWLVLKLKTSTSIKGKSTVTADLLHDNKGVYHSPANGHVSNIKVTFTTTMGTIKSPVYMINGVAKSTLNRGAKKGTVYVSAKVSNQTMKIQQK